MLFLATKAVVTLPLQLHTALIVDVGYSESRCLPVPLYPPIFVISFLKLNRLGMWGRIANASTSYGALGGPGHSLSLRGVTKTECESPKSVYRCCEQVSTLLKRLPSRFLWHLYYSSYPWCCYIKFHEWLWRAPSGRHKSAPMHSPSKWRYTPIMANRCTDYQSRENWKFQHNCTL